MQIVMSFQTVKCSEPFMLLYSKLVDPLTHLCFIHKSCTGHHLIFDWPLLVEWMALGIHSFHYVTQLTLLSTAFRFLKTSSLSSFILVDSSIASIGSFGHVCFYLGNIFSFLHVVFWARISIQTNCHSSRLQLEFIGYRYKVWCTEGVSISYYHYLFLPVILFALLLQVNWYTKNAFLLIFNLTWTRVWASFDNNDYHDWLWQCRSTVKSIKLSEEKWNRQKKTGSQTDVKKLIVESERETTRQFSTLWNCWLGDNKQRQTNRKYEGQTLTRRQSNPQMWDGILHEAVQLQTKN